MPRSLFADSSRRLTLEVRHLRLVRAIVENGSVTRAAGELHLSQSALSHQLLTLEDDLKVKLFDRVGRRMVPTAAGIQLVDAAERILAQLEEVERDVARTARDDRMPLRVAATCPSYYSWLASSLAKFSTSQPHLDIQVSLQPVRRESEMLMDDLADLIVTSRPVATSAFECRKLFALEVVALLPKAHPVLAQRGPAGRTTIRWCELADATVLVHDLPSEDEAHLRAAIRADVAATGGAAGEPRIWRVGLTEAIAELARTGHGIGVVARPISGVPAIHGALVMRPLRPRHDRAFFAVWRKSNPRALPLEALALSLAEVMQSTGSTTTKRIATHVS
jgi:LysR family transcriptional regulator, regulator for metE and metH